MTKYLITLQCGHRRIAFTRNPHGKFICYACNGKKVPRDETMAAQEIDEAPQDTNL